jgi:hypothetical protein
MTALLVVLLVMGAGIAAWLYIDKTMDFDDKEEIKEQLPVENPEVEKPKTHKKPYRRKPQAKKK